MLYAWTSNSRIIIPFSDDRPYEGSDLLEPFDTRSIDAAKVECKNNNVVAFPLYGAQDMIPVHASPAKFFMQSLASYTGGSAYPFEYDAMDPFGSRDELINRLKSVVQTRTGPFITGVCTTPPICCCS